MTAPHEKKTPKTKGAKSYIYRYNFRGTFLFSEILRCHTTSDRTQFSRERARFLRVDRHTTSPISDLSH